MEKTISIKIVIVIPSIILSIQLHMKSQGNEYPVRHYLVQRLSSIFFTYNFMVLKRESHES